MPAIFLNVPGKTILFGEHAVVYGFPAIAVPLNSISLQISIFPKPKTADNQIIIFNTNNGNAKKLEDLDSDHPLKIAFAIIRDELSIDHFPSMEIRISSSIPIAAGLGSSAALAVGLSKSIASFLGFQKNLEELNHLAFKLERIEHGIPSGIDNTVICYNKPIYFQKNRPLHFIQILRPFQLIIADSGIRTPTKKTVAEIQEKYESEKREVESLFEEIGNISQKALSFLENNEIEKLGEMMNWNQHILQKLGVSCSELDQLVDTALDNGAYGAKLCGGGKGGNIVAVAAETNIELICQQLRKKHAIHCFVETIRPAIIGE